MDSKIGHIVGLNDHTRGWWQRWVMDQGAVWVDKGGTVHLIERLDCRYALNILRFVFIQHSHDLPPKPMDSPLVRALVAQVRRECTPVLAATTLFALHGGLVDTEDLVVLS